MRKGPLTALIVIIILIVIALGVWFVFPANNSTTGTVATSTTPVASSTGLNFDQSLTDGALTMNYPSFDFTVATTSSAITAHSYIPPCTGNFDDCLFYTGSAYTGTNFESAGLRVLARADLTTQSKCLNTEPAGFTGLLPTIATTSDYAVSTFSPLSDAAAGHLGNGALYRLELTGVCYELQTTIGQSDYLNYPSGSIQQFTNDDEAAVQNELQSILNTLTLASGETVVLPPLSSTSQNAQ